VVDAWIKWSCQKRFEYLNWLLKVARKHRPELYLTINQCTIYDALQAAYWGGEPVTVYFDQAKLKAHGINSYHDFLKLVCIDPALYSGDGFCFVMEVERSRNHGDEYKWPSPYDAPDFGKIRDGFGGGIGISAPLYDECSKPLKGWSCQYVRDQRRFRRDFVEGLLKANAREFYLSTFDWPGDGRCYDMRTFAVPFQLLPFAKPEEFKGTISDTSKQAVIKKYADRYGLMNAGDLPTDVTLTLPAGMTRLFDLSNGIRQELSVAADRTVKIHLEQWSLKTMEIK